MEYFAINFSASIMIGFTFLIRKLAKNHLPHTVFTFLWIFIVLRLLTPFISIETPYSYLNLQVPIERTLNSATILPDDFLLSDIHYNVEEIIIQKKNLLLSLWFVGFCFVSTYFILLYISMIKDVKTAQPLPENEYLNKLINEQKIRRTIILKQANYINSPAVLGFWKPIILFPKNYNFTDKECLKFVVFHECGHIKYFHFSCKVVSMLLMSLYWYNPFIWVLYLYLDRDMEISSDCYALRQLKLDYRAKYAKNLLRAIKTKKKFPIFIIIIIKDL